MAALGFLRWFGFDSKFYYPNDRIYLRPEDLGLRYEDVSFSTRDGLRLHGWFLPAEGTPRGLVVHFHGNAANITAHLTLVEWLPRNGYHVLMFDYRGYGRSAGRVTRAGTILDGHAAIDYALKRPEVAGLPLLVYGQSLGGAVAIVVAVEHPEVAAVVVESTFGSYRAIAARHVQQLVFSPWLARGVASFVISAGNDPKDFVAKLAPRPLLVITAGADTICHPELGRSLFDAAAEPKTFWQAEGAEHLALLETHDQELMRRILEFFEQATVSAPPGVSGARELP